MKNIIKVVESISQDENLINHFNFYLKKYNNDLSKKKFDSILENLIFIRSQVDSYCEKNLYYFHIHLNQIYKISISPKVCDPYDGSYSILCIKVEPSTEFQSDSDSSNNDSY